MCTDFCVWGAMQGLDAKENVSVANNACWAIGEVAVKVCSPSKFSINFCMPPTPPPAHSFQVLSLLCILFYIM